MAREKDHYSILGVEPHASAQEIREAYLARSRAIHPDQFDRASHPREWARANDSQAELNGAYAVLKYAEQRRAYDQRRQASIRDNEPSRTPKSSSSDYRGPQASEGYYRYEDLPADMQSRLRNRQRNGGEDQFQLLEIPFWRNLAFVVLAACWFVVMFAIAGGERWSALSAIGYSIVTVAVSVAIGWNALHVVRWCQSTVVPAFYVSPLYFIRTGNDVVGFWPIWSLKDERVTHRFQNGSYKDSIVVLLMHDREEQLTLHSKKEVGSLFARIRDYEQRFANAVRNRDSDYFSRFDDFRLLDKSTIPQVDSLNGDNSTNMQRGIVFGTSLVSCLLLLVLIAAFNASQRGTDEWFRHRDLAAIQPSSTSPSLPLANRSQSPSRVSDTPKVPSQPIPANGWTQHFVTERCIAPLEIRADIGSHYLVKVVRSDGAAILTVFVRSGATAQVEVPTGQYQVRYAAGTEWYGSEYLFGPETAYSKADKLFHFTQIGDEVNGYTITLYKVPNGNLGTVAIAPTEF